MQGKMSNMDAAVDTSCRKEVKPYNCNSRGRTKIRNMLATYVIILVITTLNGVSAKLSGTSYLTSTCSLVGCEIAISYKTLLLTSSGAASENYNLFIGDKNLISGQCTNDACIADFELFPREILKALYNATIDEESDIDTLQHVSDNHDLLHNALIKFKNNNTDLTSKVNGIRQSISYHTQNAVKYESMTATSRASQASAESATSSLVNQVTSCRNSLGHRRKILAPGTGNIHFKPGTVFISGEISTAEYTNVCGCGAGECLLALAKEDKITGGLEASFNPKSGDLDSETQYCKSKLSSGDKYCGPITCANSFRSIPDDLIIFGANTRLTSLDARNTINSINVQQEADLEELSTVLSSNDQLAREVGPLENSLKDSKSRSDKAVDDYSKQYVVTQNALAAQSTAAQQLAACNKAKADLAESKGCDNLVNVENIALSVATAIINREYSFGKPASDYCQLGWGGALAQLRSQGIINERDRGGQSCAKVCEYVRSEFNQCSSILLDNGVVSSENYLDIVIRDNC